MNIFKTNFRIKKIGIVIISLLIVTTFVTCLFLKATDTKWAGILSGLAAGLFVAIIQLIIAWQDFVQTEKLRKLKLIEILYSRDNRTFYENYIKKSKKEIKMMGVTASRFFIDFADLSEHATSNAKVLLEALSRGVKVKILVPDKNFLDPNREKDIDKVKNIVKEIKKAHPQSSLQVKYFKHIAAHGVFGVDDKCIVGPVFPNVESKYTPALLLKSSSPIANKYLEYFDDEWDKANE